MFKRVTAVTLVSVMMLFGLALAQDQNAKSADKAQSPIVIVEPAGIPQGMASADAAAAGIGLGQGDEEDEELMEVSMSESGDVTLNLRDADIRNVVKMLAYKSGVNIIVSPEVDALVTIQLKNVPWQKALDVILSTYGYGYEQKGSVMMVTTIDNLKKRREDSRALAEQEPLGTETYILNFAKAEDVLKSIDKMITARGSINFDARTNAIVVTDVLSNLVSLKEIIAKLDTVTPQVLIEARIIETALSDQETLGIKWPTSFGGSATMPIRTHIFPWSSNKNNYLPSATWAHPDKIGDATADAATTTVMSYGTISLTNLALTLDMLQSRANTNVLSNPRIVTLDNQPAKINVGNKYPLPKYTYSDTQDKLMISGWEYIEYGLTFKVTPHINSKGVVTLDVEPEVVDSSASVLFDFGGATTAVPVLTTESAKTNVMIRDGETLVIAGLIKDKKTNVTRKVPLLGSIPFVGRLFRHKDDVTIKTELVIFITPHIITPDMASSVVVPSVPASDVVEAK